LLDAQWSYRKLYRLIFRYDAQIKQTQLSETYQYAQWLQDNNPEETVALFAVDENEQLYWFTQDEELEVQPGWTIYALAKPNRDSAQELATPA